MIIKYIITVLGVTWGLTVLLFLNPQTGLDNYAFIMFVPLIITLLFNKIEEKRTGNKVKILKKHFNKKAMLFGCLYPIGFISICAATAVILMHEAVMVENNLVIWFITELLTILIGLFFTLGEEYGWRGYLLPGLTKIYGKRKAVIITGIVWSLYHIPVIYLLAKSTGLGNPLFLCAIQSGVVFVSNFAFSYCYYLSESIIPVMFYHSIWNVFNTAVLGDIYNGKQGAISGNILVINGEGILGLILATIAGVYFWKKLSSNEELG